MTEEERQDQAWACLPSEVRRLMRKEYGEPTKTEYEQGYDNALRNYFGHHNLTSDSEPEEMVSVSRKQMQKAYALHKLANNHTICQILYGFFGTKCLPDEPLQTSEKVEESSVKVEPTQTNDNMEEKEHRNLSQDSANCDKSEEKELNLCEILKGYEGETFYSRCFGPITLLLASKLTFKCPEDDRVIQYYINGQYSELGEQDLFPSKSKQNWLEWQEERTSKRWRANKGEVYYLLRDDGQMGITCDDYTNNDDNHYRAMNYFASLNLAKQAAEAVKATLEQFHKNISND